jgi:ABC-type multidrug transport system fused ATPase/permease subunit
MLPWGTWIRPNPRTIILLNMLWEMLQRYPWYFIMLVSILVVEGIVAAVMVFAIAPLADMLMHPGLEGASELTLNIVVWLNAWDIEPGVLFFASFFLVATLAKSLLAVATRYAILQIKYSIGRDMEEETLTAFFRARWSFFTGAEQGALLNTFQRELSNVSDTLGHLATLMATSIQFFIYLVVPLWLNAKMALFSVGVGTVLVIPFFLIQSTNYRLGKRNTETANVLTGALQEILTAAKLVLGFARQKQAVNRYVSAFDEHRKVSIRSQTLSFAVLSLYEPVGIAAALAAFLVALHGGTPISEVAAVLWGLLRALGLIGKLLQGKTIINNFIPSYEQLVRLRDDAENTRQTDGGTLFKELREEIVFSDVSFAYTGRILALNKIDMRISRGAMVALVGGSGAGKSTIVDLLLGLLEVESGGIYVDGEPLANLDLNSFRERIGYVPQEAFLFHTSIRDNLLWANPEATDNEIAQACRLANAGGFIEQMPEGLGTVVGDRGVRLSGGQRQRLALARALLRKPDLLILDEATSSLDTESERLIQQSIEKISNSTTILIIAHRLSTITDADYIYVLEEGGVSEEGTYAELNNTTGVLQRMVTLQQLK